LPYKGELIGLGMITDKLGRPMKDLRISVIDRCNFRCRYCMPKEIFGRDYAFMPKEALLRFSALERLAKILVDLCVTKMRLNDRERLLRRDLTALISWLMAIEGLKDIGLTTNGFLLEHMAQTLKNAGLKRVNVSVDALDDAVFKAINDSGVG